MKQEMDINLWTSFEKNIQSIELVFEKLVEILEEGEFIVTIDTLFTAGERTISGSIKNIKRYFYIINMD